MLPEQSNLLLKSSGESSLPKVKNIADNCIQKKCIKLIKMVRFYSYENVVFKSFHSIVNKQKNSFRVLLFMYKKTINKKLGVRH